MNTKEDEHGELGPLPRSKLNKNDPGSTRYTHLGEVMRDPNTGDVLSLLDTIAFKSEYCPFCKSDNTFHARVCRNGLSDQIDCVWRKRKEYTNISIITKKFDFCFECRKEFLMECFCWSKLQYRKTEETEEKLTLWEKIKQFFGGF